jgi:mRNA interferase HigB
MNVLSRPTIDSAARRHPEAATWLNAWWRRARRERWRSLYEVRRTYPSADQVGRCLVFNACGNKYRLIVGVLYAEDGKGGTLFVKHFLTHAEYDKSTWKKDCLP